MKALSRLTSSPATSQPHRGPALTGSQEGQGRPIPRARRAGSVQGLLRYAAARSTHVPVWLLLLLLVAAWGVLGAAWGLLQALEEERRLLGPPFSQQQRQAGQAAGPNSLHAGGVTAGALGSSSTVHLRKDSSWDHIRPLPKVALLFLAPYGPAHEPLWRAFLEQAWPQGPSHMVSHLMAALGSAGPMPRDLKEALSGPAAGVVDLEGLVGGPLHPPAPSPSPQPAGASNFSSNLPAGSFHRGSSGSAPEAHGAGREPMQQGKHGAISAPGSTSAGPKAASPGPPPHNPGDGTRVQEDSADMAPHAPLPLLLRCPCGPWHARTACAAWGAVRVAWQKVGQAGVEQEASSSGIPGAERASMGIKSAGAAGVGSTWAHMRLAWRQGRDRRLCKPNLHGNSTHKQQQIEQEARRLERASSMASGPESPYTAQQLFSVYVHTQPGVSHPSGSLFAGRELAMRIDIHGAYGQPALMQAARLLLAEALRDPLNLRFVLLSDSSIPLVPPALVWAQLMSESKSRVDACLDVDMDRHRCPPGLWSDHLRPEHWRKSSQWWVLGRAHAALAVADTHVAPLFERHCRSAFTTTAPGQSGGHGSVQANSTASFGAEAAEGAEQEGSGASLLGPRKDGLGVDRMDLPDSAFPTQAHGANSKRDTGAAAGTGGNATGLAQEFKRKKGPAVCVADEHYFPTLLASYGLDTQTDCLGVPTFADWVHAHGSHPATIWPAQLGPGLTSRLHTQHDAGGRTAGMPACDWGASAASLAAAASAAAGREGARAGAEGATAAEGATLCMGAAGAQGSFDRMAGRPHQEAASGAAHAQGPDPWAAGWVRASGYQPLSSRCSLFARKFPGASHFLLSTAAGAAGQSGGLEVSTGIGAASARSASASGSAGAVFTGGHALPNPAAPTLTPGVACVATGYKAQRRAPARKRTKPGLRGKAKEGSTGGAAVTGTPAAAAGTGPLPPLLPPPPDVACTDLGQAAASSTLRWALACSPEGLGLGPQCSML